MEERESSQLGAFAIVGSSVETGEKDESGTQADGAPIPTTTPSKLRRREIRFTINVVLPRKRSQQGARPLLALGYGSESHSKCMVDVSRVEPRPRRVADPYCRMFAVEVSPRRADAPALP